MLGEEETSGSVVSASTLLDQKVVSSSWPVHPRCVLKAKHLTLTVPLSTWVYKWEPANYLGTT